jgi:hypothetical protein
MKYDHENAASNRPLTSGPKLYSLDIAGIATERTTLSM